MSNQKTTPRSTIETEDSRGQKESEKPISRRSVLASGAAVGSVVFAGCSTDSDLTSETEDGVNNTASQNQETDNDSGNVFSTHPWPSIEGNAAQTRYLSTNSGPGPELEEVWSTTVESPAANIGPIVTQNHVITADTSSKLYALDPMSGEINWETSLETTPNQPLLANESTLVVQQDQRIVGRSLADGSMQFDTTIDIPSEPASSGQDSSVNQTQLIAHNGTLFYGFNGKSNRYAIDITDGSQRWKTSDDWLVETDPSASNGMVIFPVAKNTNNISETGYIAHDATSGEQVWELSLEFQERPVVARSAVITDDLIIARFTNRGEPVNWFASIDLASGELLSVTFAGAGREFPNRIVATDGEDVFMHLAERLHGVIPLDNLTGNNTSFDSDASRIYNGLTRIDQLRFDVLTDQYAYVRTGNSQFSIFDRGTNEIVSTQKSDWEISSAAVAGEFLFLGTGRGEVIGYGPS